MNECKVESVFLDTEKKECLLKTQKGLFTASKVIVTPSSSFAIDGSYHASRGSHKFYHLYLLLQDPTPARFSYRSGATSGISRMMNLTSFVGIGHTGQQLIVVQTYSDQQFAEANRIVQDLKRANLIDMGAYLLKAESYVYEQGPYFHTGDLKQSQKPYFEVLNTSHFNVINSYTSRWKKALPRYIEGLP